MIAYHSNPNPVSKKTEMRLAQHGLVLQSVCTPCKDVHEQIEIKDDGFYVILGSNVDIESVSQDGLLNGRDIESFMSEVLSDQCGQLLSTMYDGAFWSPIYDIGDSDYNLTTTDKGDCGWHNLCGAVFTDVRSLCEKAGTSSMTPAMDSETFKVFERKLRENSAYYNDDIFTLEVMTASDSKITAAAKKDLVLNIDNDIDKEVNVLIDKTLAITKNNEQVVELIISPKISSNVKSVPVYLLKKIKAHFGFNMVLGEAVFDAKTGTLIVHFTPDYIPKDVFTNQSQGSDVFTEIQFDTPVDVYTNFWQSVVPFLSGISIKA